MKINRNNCEAAFLDYYEGNLSPVEVAEMLLFLEENADLKGAFENYKTIILDNDKIYFPGKESLKKKYSPEEIDKILSSEITRANCEQFFVASMEGLLSLSDNKRLSFFLSQNPELKKDFELFQRCVLFSDTVSFEEKELLKKETITEHNREEYFVRAIENELNEKEQKQLNLFLQKHPEFQKEFLLFNNTIIPSDEISFDNKSSLRKKERKPAFILLDFQRTMYYAAAAAVLFLAGLFFFFRNTNSEQPYYAQQKTIQSNISQNTERTPNSGQLNSPVQHNESTEKKNDNPQIKIQTSVKTKPVSVSPAIYQTQKKLQPVILEDTEEKLIAQLEPIKLQLMIEEDPDQIIVQKKTADGIEATNQPMMASLNQKSSDDGYEPLKTVVVKKIKSAIGVNKTNPCEQNEKLGWWDLAIAAKTGIQNLIGTKAVDVNKVCDGTADKVEYVFTAGNFQISKSVPK